MKSGYKILWTDNALDELEKTIQYLEREFSDKEIRKLALKIESFITLISKNPTIFPKSEFNDIHKVVILKYNTLYYRIKEDQVEIISFFSNRQAPNKRKL